MMEKCKERILKRINSQYKAAIVTALIIVVIGLIIACIQGDFIAGLVLFTLISIVALIASLPILLDYKKSIKKISCSEPIICTVTKSGKKHLSRKRTYQVAYFIYDGEECYAFDYEKQLNEIEAGQQLYVWKITKKKYEIVHVE